MLIARLVNHRNPHIAMLTLALLDTLVQSCGYAFHLQIATKEFLNELVRRFPERPPPFPGPVMSRILELIHTWKEGICTESRWKDDLGNIRDMHRLLTFKGYRFRDMPRGNRNQTAVATSVGVYLSLLCSIVLATGYSLHWAARSTYRHTSGVVQNGILCTHHFRLRRGREVPHQSSLPALFRPQGCDCLSPVVPKCQTER